MKWAWIENGKIRDIAPGNPVEWYHMDVAQFYNTEVPDSAENGYLWDGQKATALEIVTVVIDEAEVKVWRAEDVRSNLTLQEKVKWDNNSAPEIITVKQELLFSKTTEELAELIDLLVSSGVISQISADKFK